mgnify:CR=1 FL=1
MACLLHRAMLTLFVAMAMAVSVFAADTAAATKPAAGAPAASGPAMPNPGPLAEPVGAILPGDAIVHVSFRSLEAMQANVSTFVEAVTKGNPMMEMPAGSLQLALVLPAKMGLQPGTVEANKPINILVFSPKGLMGVEPVALVLPVADFGKFKDGITAAGGEIATAPDGSIMANLAGTGTQALVQADKLVIMASDAVVANHAKEFLAKNAAFKPNAIETDASAPVASVTVDVRKILGVYEPELQMAAGIASMQAMMEAQKYAKKKPEEIPLKARFKMKMTALAPGYITTMLQFAKQFDAIQTKVYLSGDMARSSTTITPVSGGALSKFAAAHQGNKPQLAKYLPAECSMVSGGFVKGADYQALTEFVKQLITDIAGAAEKPEIGAKAASAWQSLMGLYAGEYAGGIYMRDGDKVMTQINIMAVDPKSSAEKTIRELFASMNVVIKELVAIFPEPGLTYNLTMADQPETIGGIKTFATTIVVGTDSAKVLDMTGYIAETDGCLILAYGDHAKDAIAAAAANIKAKKSGIGDLPAFQQALKNAPNVEIGYVYAEPVGTTKAFLANSIATMPAEQAQSMAPMMAMLSGLKPAEGGVILASGVKGTGFNIELAAPAPVINTILTQGQQVFMMMSMMQSRSM